MNKDLYNEIIYLPKEILNNLLVCFKQVPNSDTNTEGHKRNLDLRNNKYATYQQLGRIKNFFDNFNGEKDETSYVLNGGDFMRNWVDQTLGIMRNGDKFQKKIDNEYKKPIFNNDDELKDLGWLVDFDNPSDDHYGTIDKLKINESISRINNLIKKTV